MQVGDTYYECQYGNRLITVIKMLLELDGVPYVVYTEQRYGTPDITIDKVSDFTKNRYTSWVTAKKKYIAANLQQQQKELLRVRKNISSYERDLHTVTEDISNSDDNVDD